MNLVATINGVPVYSDKAVRSINGSRITFADGSWCDASTKESLNIGPGYLTLGGGNKSAAKITRGPTTYKASSLDIGNVAADVHIRVGGSMDVAITGPEDEVKSIRVNEQRGRLVIEGDGQSRGGSTFIQTGRGGVSFGRNASNNVTITGQVGSVSFGGNSDQPRETKILVMVPEGTPITVSDVAGKTEIGDTNGPLNAFSQAGDIEVVGKVRDANLSIQGGSDIRVKEINGTLSASVQGSGDVIVQSGTISSLTATVQGSGNIECKVRAQSADLSVMGSGDINVAHVENRPMQRVMGSGDINIGNW